MQEKIATTATILKYARQMALAISCSTFSIQNDRFQRSFPHIYVIDRIEVGIIFIKSYYLQQQQQEVIPCHMRHRTTYHYALLYYYLIYKIYAAKSLGYQFDNNVLIVSSFRSFHSSNSNMSCMCIEHNICVPPVTVDLKQNIIMLRYAVT